MANKLMSIEVRGNKKRWGFNFYGDPAHIPAWESDGLTVHVIENVIPRWIAGLGLVRPWCFLQDVFNFRNPFR